MPAARVRVFAGVLITALLTSCLHLQLGGPVTEATVTIQPLRDTENLFTVNLTSPPLADVRQQNPGTWDSWTDRRRMAELGNVFPNPDVYDDTSFYLATASQGVDQDANTDLVLDAAPADVLGSWHAILTGAQVAEGNVSALTEAIYRVLQPDIDSLSDSALQKELDKAARQVVIDINGDDNINYQDVMLWVRHANPDTYLRDLSLVDNLSAAVRDNAPEAQLLELSRAVLGLPPENSDGNTLSGTITVTPGSQLDSDVNDRNAPFADNSSFANAQEIVTPGVVGGYVNEPGRGFQGRSFENGDLDDYFRVSLLQGQFITLVHANSPQSTDLDLYLYDESENLLDSSMGIDRVEQLQAPYDGEFVVRVNLASFYTAYRLTFGGGAESAVTGLLRLSDEFVPGEIVAHFDTSQSGVVSMSARAALTGMQVKGAPDRINLLTLQQKPGIASTRDRKLETLLAIKELRKSGQVLTADPNYLVRASAVPTDILYNEQSWHYEQIKLPAAWDKSTGEGVIVAVVDSGIRPEHPDMQGQLVQGYDFVSSRFLSYDGDGIDPDPTDTGDGGGLISSTFHGTHVSGTVAAATNNGTGGAGTAWDAKIMPLRGLGGGGVGSTYDVMQAVRYAAGLSNDSGTTPERPADIINLSLEGPYSSSEERVYDKVRERGIISVAAAGNSSSDVPAFPAGYESTVSVSSTNINRELASYSNFGSRISVAAPGGDAATGDVNGDGFDDMVLSTAADDTGAFIEPTYTLLQGTSMASPHMAGVVALMKSVYPGLDLETLNTLLASGQITDDIGDPGRDDQFGWGLINANKAVLAAQSLATGEDIDNLPSLFVYPSTLNFGTSTETLLLDVQNGGTGSLTVTSVAPNASWITVTPFEVDASGQGTYLVSIDRASLAEGLRGKEIVVSSSAGDTEVPVRAYKLGPGDSENTDAGPQYVLLINADSGDINQQVTAAVSNGTYSYQFNDVPAGRYQIVSGSDLDSNFQICGRGESCGAWPVRDGHPTSFDVSGDIPGLDFSTTFATGIVSQRSEGEEDGEGGFLRSRYGEKPPEKSCRSRDSAPCRKVH